MNLFEESLVTIQQEHEITELEKKKELNPQIIQKLKKLWESDLSDSERTRFKIKILEEFGVAGEQVLEELFNSAPKQQRYGSRILGAFGQTKGKTATKIYNLYKKTWAEYIKWFNTTSKANQGLGQPPLKHTINTVDSVLIQMGVDPNILNVVFSGPKYGGGMISNKDQIINEKTAGSYIYDVLRQRYSGVAAYQSDYRLPNQL